jgi:thymidylate synthase
LVEIEGHFTHVFITYHIYETQDRLAKRKLMLWQCSRSVSKMRVGGNRQAKEFLSNQSDWQVPSLIASGKCVPVS